MVKLSLEMKKRDLVWVVPLFFVLVVGFVVAYTYDGSGNPEVMGHSADELNLSGVCLSDGTNCPSEADCYTTGWGSITACLNYPVADIPSCSSGYTFSGLAAVYQGDSGCGVSTLTKQKVKTRCCK